jgi:hypothetical protein
LTKFDGDRGALCGRKTGKRDQALERLGFVRKRASADLAAYFLKVHGSSGVTCPEWI